MQQPVGGEGFVNVKEKKIYAAQRSGRDAAERKHAWLRGSWAGHSSGRTQRFLHFIEFIAVQLQWQR